MASDATSDTPSSADDARTVVPVPDSVDMLHSFELGATAGATWRSRSDTTVGRGGFAAAKFEDMNYSTQRSARDPSCRSLRPYDEHTAAVSNGNDGAGNRFLVQGANGRRSRDARHSQQGIDGLDSLQQDQLRQLITARPDGACVSIYLPTHRAGRDTEQDPVRFKNLLRKAEHELAVLGLRKTDIASLLQRPHRLLDDAAFWANQTDGLAVLANASTCQVYRLGPTDESVTVGNRFRCIPLFGIVDSGDRYYVLAFSQNEVRLFLASRFDIEILEVEDMPTSLAAALAYDDKEKHLEYHQVGRGGQTPIYHGQGAAGDAVRKRIDVERFAQKVDAYLHELDGDHPLLLAGVAWVLDTFRSVSKYKPIFDGQLQGSPEAFTAAELHARAEDALAAERAVEMSENEDEIASKIGNGQATTTLREILPAVLEGRVASIVAVRGATAWGTYDQSTGLLDEHVAEQPGDEDLIDFATGEAYVRGGVIHLVDAIPGEAAIAAAYRF